MDLKPEHSRAGRALLNWTQQELSRMSGAGLTAIKDFESGTRNTSKVNRDRIQKALTDAGVQFLNGDTPGVRLVGMPEPQD